MSEEQEEKPILSREEYFKLFKDKEDGTVEICGFIFDPMEVAQAKDFYAMCESSGIFSLPRKELIEFLNLNNIAKSAGARITLSMIFDSDDLGVFLLKEDDKRIVGLAKNRLEKEQYGLEIDSPIIIARR